jgi:Spy/CpxP family protein refolding chaperone
MKKLTVMIASMMLFAGVSIFACGGSDCDKDGSSCGKESGKSCEKGGKGGKHGSRMIKALGLSEEQAIEVKTIHEEYHAKMENASDAEKDQLKSEMVEMINNVLTDEQRTKFAAMREKCEKDGKDCDKGGKGCGKDGKGCEDCDK